MQTLVDGLGDFIGRAWQIERELRRNELATRFFATNRLQIVCREHAREGEEPGLRPFLIQEMIVATGAFHAGAEKNLPDGSRALDRVHVRFVSDVSCDYSLAVGLADDRF